MHRPAIEPRKTYHPGCRHSSECGRPYAWARHSRAPGGCGCSGHPAFPKPSLGGESFGKSPGASRRRGANARLQGRMAFQIRSAHLTIFWRCDHPPFSFRTGRKRADGNEPSMVLAKDALSKGSGNADSQPNVRSSGWGGQCRLSRSCSGCVLAHPASWRASASYRPLRAVWADCAWALRGCARSPDPLSARSSAHS
jgi:hypothetical protein